MSYWSKGYSSKLFLHTCKIHENTIPFWNTQFHTKSVFWFLPTTNHWHTLSPQSRVFGAARHDNVQFVASHMASKHSKKWNKTQNSQKNEKNIVSSPLQGKLNRSSLFSFNFNQNEIGWKWMKMNDIPRGQSVPFSWDPPTSKKTYVHTLDNRRTCKQPSLQNNSEFVTTCK